MKNISFLSTTELACIKPRIENYKMLCSGRSIYPRESDTKDIMLTCRNGIIFILIFLLSLCCLSDSSAHDEDITHREITAIAIERLSLADFLRFLQLRSQFHWSLSNLVALLRMNLFTHRDLWAWLNKPFDVLPIPYEPEQLRLHLG